ncbi:MAG: hypothetical protein AAGF73_18175 [Actinomycetota bacterium]
MTTHDTVAAALETSEALRDVHHLDVDELTPQELYLLVSALQEVVVRLPTALDRAARLVEALADDPALGHDGGGDLARSAQQRARDAAMQLRRATDQLPGITPIPAVRGDGTIERIDVPEIIKMLNDAYADLGTLKRDPKPHQLARMGITVSTIESPRG